MPIQNFPVRPIAWGRGGRSPDGRRWPRMPGTICACSATPGSRSTVSMGAMLAVQAFATKPVGRDGVQGLGHRGTDALEDLGPHERGHVLGRLEMPVVFEDDQPVAFGDAIGG